MRKLLLTIGFAAALMFSGRDASATSIAIFGNNQTDNFLAANGYVVSLVTDAQIATPGFLNGFDAFYYTRDGFSFGASLSAAAAAQVIAYATGNAVALLADFADGLPGAQASDPGVQTLTLNAVAFAVAHGHGFVGELNGAAAAMTANANGLAPLALFVGSAGALGGGAGGSDGRLVADPANAGSPILVGAGLPFNPLHRPVEPDVETRCLDGTVEQGGVAFVDVEVRLVTRDIGLQPPLQREHGRLNRVIVLDELFEVSARDRRARQDLRQLGHVQEGGERRGAAPRAAEAFRKTPDFIERQERWTGQLRIGEELAVQPRISLADVGDKRQTELGDELVNDRLSPMNELSAEFDRVTREGAAREDSPTDAIARLQADGGAPGLHQLAHGKNTGRPGADDDDIGPIRQLARRTRRTLHAVFIATESTGEARFL